MVHLPTITTMGLENTLLQMQGYFVICNRVICKLSPRVGEGQRWERYVLKNTQQGKI